MGLWYRLLTGEFFRLHIGGDAPAAPPPTDPWKIARATAWSTPSYYGPGGSVSYSGDPKRGTFRQDVTLSPDQQRQYDARNRVAEALYGRAEKALPGMPASFEFRGAEDPTTNRFFMAQKALLDPVFAQDEERERQRLANQGLPEGSEAATEAMDDFARRKASAYEQAAANALGQGYGQALSSRQQQLNEVAQAMGGGVTMPQPAQNPVDMNSAFAQNQAGKNLQYQGQLAGYNANVGTANSAMGGLFGLGSSALMAAMLCDIRLKKDITRIGPFKPGIDMYSFRYKNEADDAPLRFGVMAQEVVEVAPWAVFTRDDGMMVVDMMQVVRL